MTPSALQATITGLRQAAQGMGEPERALRLQVVDALETGIHGMALDAIVNRLEHISPSSQHDMDALIHKAGDPANAHNKRVQCFDQALGLLEAALGLAA